MANVKCPVCGESFDRDKEECVAYNKRYYHIECFETEFDEDTVDKHYFYLTFQSIFDRVPHNLEWIQMKRMVEQDGWTWRKLEDVLVYVYRIERKSESDEYGTVGILPYYELKAKKFYRTKWEADEHNASTEVEYEEVEIYSRQDPVPVKQKPKKDIDRIFEDDDCWEDEY